MKKLLYDLLYGTHKPTQEEVNRGVLWILLGIFIIPIILLIAVNPTWLARFVSVVWVTIFTTYYLGYLLLIKRINFGDASDSSYLSRERYGKAFIRGANVFFRALLLFVFVGTCWNDIPETVKDFWMISKNHEPQIIYSQVEYAEHNLWSLGGIIDQQVTLSGEDGNWRIYFHYPAFRSGTQKYKLYVIPNSRIILDADLVN